MKFFESFPVAASLILLRFSKILSSTAIRAQAKKSKTISKSRKLTPMFQNVDPKFNVCRVKVLGPYLLREKFPKSKLLEVRPKLSNLIIFLEVNMTQNS